MEKNNDRYKSFLNIGAIAVGVAMGVAIVAGVGMHMNEKAEAQRVETSQVFECKMDVSKVEYLIKHDKRFSNPSDAEEVAYNAKHDALKQDLKDLNVSQVKCNIAKVREKMMKDTHEVLAKHKM